MMITSIYDRWDQIIKLSHWQQLWTGISKGLQFLRGSTSGLFLSKQIQPIEAAQEIVEISVTNDSYCTLTIKETVWGSILSV